MAITHTKVSAITDGSDTDLVRPSDWNADHTIADKSISYTKLADGTDGNLITWDASGVAALVATGTATHVLTSNGAGAAPTFQAAGSGTVTSVAQSFTGGLISVSGSPISTSGTLALTVAGTSGGIPYFSGATTWASSAALAASALVLGGGAGAAPATTTTGTGVVTALGVNVGSAGAVVVLGGALGTPSSGVGTNLTGIPVSALASGTLAENVDFALDAVLSADGKYSGVVVAGTSSAALAFGELCYRVTATGKWALAKADVVGTSINELGICVLAAAGADAATTILKYGKVRADTLFDTFTVGAPVYISAATAGKIVSAKPTGTTDFVVRCVGHAEDANTVFFSPSDDYVTLV